jgi:D-alanyl-lipoteichoic acid acyltransferase DltB (MBOAT superfamily)
MNFAELRFWGYLVAGLVVLLGARGLLVGMLKFPAEPIDKLVLLSLGLFLLLCVSVVTFVIFFVVAVGTYVGLMWIQRYHARHALKYLAILIPLQLLPLIYYKYADFVANRVLHLGFDTLSTLIIPVGISFYTFQKVGFVVDTLAFKHARPRFLDYLNFAGFFPQIVAGPIERRKDLLPQMEQFRFRWSAANLNEGASWLVVGLFFKCCLADNLAGYFDRAPRDNAYLIWLANLLFGLRIYYDFAGYSLIAVGLAHCLGVRLTLNFLSPYASTSIAEFWRRWHVTLSQWFRDYVYVPLGGGRVAWWAANIAVVFVVSGVWHGAGWNFVLWGALHAVFLMVNRLLIKVPVPIWLAWLLTMMASFYAWLCFYESDTGVLLAKLKLLLLPQSYHPAALQTAVHVWINAWTGAHGVVLLGVLFLTSTTLLAEWFSLRRHGEPYFLLRRFWVMVLLIFLTVLLAPGKSNGFIYFAF